MLRSRVLATSSIADFDENIIISLLMLLLYSALVENMLLIDASRIILSEPPVDEPLMSTRAELW